MDGEGLGGGETLLFELRGELAEGCSAPEAPNDEELPRRLGPVPMAFEGRGVVAASAKVLRSDHVSVSLK